MIPRARLDTLRAMYATFIDGMAVVDSADDAALLRALDVLAAAILGHVPELLDEIERLSADEPERMRTFKQDRFGGVA